MNRRAIGIASLSTILMIGTACGPRGTPEAKREAGRIGAVRDPGTGAAVGGARGEAPAVTAPPAAPAAESSEPLVIFLGDSLTAGLGLNVDQAYPALVEKLLAARGLPVRVRNAGLSGDTSAGGRERLDWFLRQKPDLMVVELGANDALRGQPLDGIEANLRDIVERCRKAGAKVVVAGMQIPTNYGPDYTRGFAAIFPRVAHDGGATFIPFLLAGVGGRPELNQADGIHPTAEGQKIVARTVADVLAPVVAKLERGAKSRAAR